MNTAERLIESLYDPNKPIREYKAAHALRGTLKRPHNNITEVDGPDGEVVRLTRAERKMLQRHFAKLAHARTAEVGVAPKYMHSLARQFAALKAAA